MFHNIKDGEWFDLTKEFKLTCCDCSLVHDGEYRMSPDNPDTIQFRVYRNKWLTTIRRKENVDEKVSNCDNNPNFSM
jgi:hypothetical protein